MGSFRWAQPEILSVHVLCHLSRPESIGKRAKMFQVKPSSGGCLPEACQTLLPPHPKGLLRGNRNFVDQPLYDRFGGLAIVALYETFGDDAVGQ